MQLGKHNRRLVEIRKAMAGSALTDDGLLPIEGTHLIEEAHRSGLEIVEVFRQRGASVKVPASAVTFELEPSVFKTIQGTETSQGIIALVRPQRYVIEDVLRQTNPLIVVLCRLQDPGNVGTIIRSAESFGATACLATKGTTSIFGSKTLRASAGSLFRLPCIGGLEPRALFTKLHGQKISLVGTAPQADRELSDWDWRKPSALLIGNEGTGLSSGEIDACDVLIRVPHRENVESLNSAVAASILLYEAWKKRE